MPRPLEGVRVLDLTHAVAGPTCTFQLAMLGATVIKVERPVTGDPLRNYSEHAGPRGMSAPFITVNSGKKSVVLNLKDREGVDALKELVKESDVFIENGRPGVNTSLGIDYDSLKAINPDLIYCSISGFGQQGLLSQWAAYDHIVQAMSGLVSVNGEPGSPSVKMGVPISDIFTGFIAVQGILAALLQRGRFPSGGGQYIDVNMLDASLTLMNQSVVSYLEFGAEPRKRGNQGFRLVPTSDTFPTATDDIAIGANEQRQYELLCTVIGAGFLIDDERFATHDGRTLHAHELREELVAIFSQFDAEDLEQRLAAVQIPVSVVRTIPQITSHPHVRASGILQETVAPGFESPITVVGPAYKFLHDGPHVSGSVPTLGEHTEEILGKVLNAKNGATG